MNTKTKTNTDIVKLETVNQINQAFGVETPEIPRGAALPTIGISRETAQYDLPEGKLVSSFTGHVLHSHYCNLYYAQPCGEGEPSPPDCFSSDGMTPDADEPMAQMCIDCAFNQYGSASSGSGKACSNQLWLHVLLDGEVIPSLLKCPPSSLNQKGSLMCWLVAAPNIAAKAGAGVSYQVVKAEFSLKKKMFRSGMSAAVVHVKTLGVLNHTDDTDAEKIGQLSLLFQSLKNTQLLRIRENLTETLSEGASAAAGKDEGDGEHIPI